MHTGPLRDATGQPRRFRYGPHAHRSGRVRVRGAPVHSDDVFQLNRCRSDLVGWLSSGHRLKSDAAFNARFSEPNVSCPKLHAVAKHSAEKMHIHESHPSTHKLTCFNQGQDFLMRGFLQAGKQRPVTEMLASTADVAAGQLAQHHGVHHDIPCRQLLNQLWNPLTHVSDPHGGIDQNHRSSSSSACPVSEGRLLRRLGISSIPGALPPMAISRRAASR